MSLQHTALLVLTTSVALLAPVASAIPFPFPRLQERAAATAYCTNWNLTYKLTQITAPTSGGGSAGGQKTWNLTFDDSTAGYKQTVNGFGAAVTDSTVSTFNSLSSSNLDALLNSLVTSSGANFQLMRHTIGASDMTADGQNYTYNDNNGQVDTNLANFTLGTYGTAMAQLLAKMKSKNANITVVGSPWSPPGWMKSNNATQGNTTNNNLSDTYLNSSQPQYAGPWANYFVKYVQAYTKLGITPDAITVQNEPLYSAAGYPTMYMFAYEQAQLIKNFVAPAFSNAGLSTSIWGYDHNTDVPDFPQTVLNYSGTGNVNTIAWHCYAGALNWTSMTTFQKANPGVKQYMTECWTPPEDQYSWHHASNFTIGPLQNWGMGSIAWALGTNSSNGPHMSGGCPTCRGLVTINNDGSYTFNLAYYLMAQYSKFMPKGATVLAGNGSSADPSTYGVQAVASLNADKSRTVVIQNTFTNSLYVTVNTTSGLKYGGSVPASSVVTWVLPSS